MYKQKNMEKKLETGLPAKNVHWVGGVNSGLGKKTVTMYSLQIGGLSIYGMVK